MSKPALLVPQVVTPALRQVAPVDVTVTPATPPYKPTTRDVEMLLAVQDVLEADGRLTNQAIADRLKISREAVRKRFAVNPAFRAWLAEQLNQAAEQNWPAVLHRATVLAMRGSIDHMRFLAQLRGAIQAPGEGAAGSGGPVVNVHLHV